MVVYYSIFLAISFVRRVTERTTFYNNMYTHTPNVIVTHPPSALRARKMTANMQKLFSQDRNKICVIDSGFGLFYYLF